MDNERDMKNVVSSSAHTWLFAVVAYCHLGIVIHRPAYYRQNHILPLLFMLFPFLYFCQVSMNWSHLRRQYTSMSRQSRREGEQGRCFLIASVLALHGTYTSDDSDQQPWKTLFKLSTVCPSSVFRYKKKKAGSFSRILFISRILLLLLGVYQGIAASIIYGQRITSLDNGTLVLDHLMGIYAICGTVVMMATTFLVLQPYEWTAVSAGLEEGDQDVISYIPWHPSSYGDAEVPEENSREVALELQEWRACEYASDQEYTYRPTMVTATVWMFDVSYAVVVHSVIFLISLFSILSTVGRKEALVQSLTWLYRLLLLLIPLFLVGTPIFQNTRRRSTNLDATAWALENKAQSWKLVVAAIALETVIALGIWILAIVEATLATSSASFTKNKDWKTPNPGARQFHHVFWSIWT
ncbi:hypothetical protein CPLU01_07278 [Colletotrichum plurivorum]|uniref:Uncharacterized protein n=1 Tax=Colletotrichum plurivorum TaxID=2175906 RepID=A0A8H6KGJ6_9PEZI|nr:hypothetical protein CPLU01_07278 [Colletotrichum plurivorum]